MYCIVDILTNQFRMNLNDFVTTFTNVDVCHFARPANVFKRNETEAFFFGEWQKENCPKDLCVIPDEANLLSLQQVINIMWYECTIMHVRTFTQYLLIFYMIYKYRRKLMHLQTFFNLCTRIKKHYKHAHSFTHTRTLIRTHIHAHTYKHTHKLSNIFI